MLDRAIEAYERRMLLDLNLNDYYCNCNLPALYRERGHEHDEEQAAAAAAMAHRSRIWRCRRSSPR